MSDFKFKPDDPHVRRYTHEEFAQHNARITQATLEIHDRVYKEVTRQMKEHLDWVVEQAIKGGTPEEDLMLIANTVDVYSSYALVIDKRRATLVGEARVTAVHDEIYLSLKSNYGTKPKDPA